MRLTPALPVRPLAAPHRLDRLDRTLPGVQHIDRATRAAAVPTVAAPAGLRAPLAPRIVPQAPGLPSLRQPQTVQDDEHLFLQFAREDAAATADIRWQFDVKTASLEGAGLRQEVLRDLHLETTRRALANWLKRAGVDNLRVTLEPSDGGICLALEGPNTWARQTLDEALHQLIRSVPSIAVFCDSRDSLRQAYAEAEGGRTPLRERHTPAQRRLALEGLRAGDLSAFARRLTDCAYVMGFLYGNMTPTDVEGVRANLTHSLQGEPYNIGRLQHRRLAS